MPKFYSSAFKAKMVERLNGNEETTIKALASETGIGKSSLSRWQLEARSLQVVTTSQQKKRTIDEKIRILSDARRLKGNAVEKFLEEEGIHPSELEQWRLALSDEDRATTAVTKRIKQLERELGRKEKALAEAAALLILKKKIDHVWAGEDDDTDESKGK